MHFFTEVERAQLLNNILFYIKDKAWAQAVYEKLKQLLASNTVTKQVKRDGSKKIVLLELIENSQIIALYKMTHMACDPDNPNWDGGIWHLNHIKLDDYEVPKQIPQIIALPVGEQPRAR